MKTKKTSSTNKKRCPWVKTQNSLYVSYHDKEWGRPVKRDSKHFEYLILEGAQAGLSWETVLNKRDNYRTVFKKFDPKKVALFTDKQLEKILKDPGVVRNRLKIYSTRQNAQAFLEVQKEWGSFNKYIWHFTDGKIIKNNPKTLKDYPSKTNLSDAISQDLKKRGFKFVGSTIIYAYLQAVGIVNDHSKECFCRNAYL